MVKGGDAYKELLAIGLQRYKNCIKNLFILLAKNVDSALNRP